MIYSDFARKKKLSKNIKIEFCIYKLRNKVEEAIQKNINYADISNMDVVSWNFIDCLVENEVIIKTVQNAKHEKITARTNTSVSDSDRWATHRDESAYCNSTYTPRGSKKKLNVRETNKKLLDCIREFSSKIDEAANKDICFTTIYQVESLSWKIIDCLVEEKIVDESVQQSKWMKWTKNNKRSHASSNAYRKQRSKSISCENLRRTPSLSKLDQADSYRSEGNAQPCLGLSELCEASCYKVDTEKKECINTYQNMTFENNYAGTNETLEARTDHIVLPTDYSSENTVEFQNKIITELEKREKQLQLALQDSKRDTKYQKTLLERCRKEQNINLSKLSSEKDQLKKQNQQRINNLNTKVWHYQKCCDEYKKTIEDIQSRRKELPFRDHNGYFQEEENFSMLIEENESLRAEIYVNEARHTTEMKEKIDCISDLKLEINNLKIQKFRAGENAIHIQKELVEDKLEFEKERAQLETEIKELRLQSTKQSSELLRYCEVGGQFDTEKENDSLKSQITDVIKRLEKSKQDYKDLADRYERKKSNAKRTLNSLQCQKNRLEQDQIDLQAGFVQILIDLNCLKKEKDLCKGNSDKLIRQNKKLESDNELLRMTIVSLENKTIELEKRYVDIEEKNHAGKENDSLKFHLSDVIKRLEISKQEYKDLVDRYRIVKVTVEKAKVTELQLRQQIEDERKNIQGMCADINSLENENNQMKVQIRHQNNQSSFQEKINTLRTENTQLKHRLNSSKNKISFLQTKNAELEIRFQEQTKQCEASVTSIHGCNRRSNEGSCADISTLTDPNRPTRLGQRFVDLYENEWKAAMSELKESGGEKQSIDFLMNILKEAYQFAESMVQRFLESFGQSLIGVNGNIQVKDGILVKLNTDHIKTVSTFLGLNLDKMFLSTFHARKYVKSGLAVRTFIKEIVLLSWLMVTRSNPLVICTKVPAMFNSATWEPYSTTGFLVDYVVWPVLYLQEGRAIIEKGIVACK